MVLKNTILALLILLSPSLYAAKAVIESPEKAKPGDLVVLNASASEGAAFKWIIPPGLQTLSCSELELGFASGTPGSYTFTLIAADTSEGAEAPIDYATHTVVVGVPVLPPPVDPVDPDKPTPGQYEQLRKLSLSAASKLGDPTTAKGLAETITATVAEIAAMCEQGQCPEITRAKQMMILAVENRLLAREGESRNANWLDGWRKPINDGLVAANTSTVPEYLSAMLAVAAGLSES